MTGVWALAALWLGLALIASLLSIWFRISTALSEIVVGTIAQLIIGAVIGSAVLGTDESWVKFLSGIGATVLTFLAGAELDPQAFRLKWKEAAAVGSGSFFFPFVACAAAAHYLLGRDTMPSWLAGPCRRRHRERRNTDDHRQRVLSCPNTCCRKKRRKIHPSRPVE
jgi:glutathione-regulated potassium-efflux system ancillary protein KefC